MTKRLSEFQMVSGITRANLKAARYTGYDHEKRITIFDNLVKAVQKFIKSETNEQTILMVVGALCVHAIAYMGDTKLAFLQPMLGNITGETITPACRTAKILILARMPTVLLDNKLHNDPKMFIKVGVVVTASASTPVDTIKTGIAP